MIDRIARSSPFQYVHNVLRRLGLELRYALRRGVGRMIGQHNIVKLAEGRLRAERFVIMRIKPRRKNAVSAQRVEQILVLDERTAADVDEDRRRLHQCKRLLADHAVCLSIGVQMEGDDIGNAEQLLLFHLAHADLSQLLSADIGIVCHDLGKTEAADLADQRARCGLHR